MTGDAFQPGDTVRLKSGGPLMTVEKTDTIANGDTVVWCGWFVNKQPKTAHYKPAMLEHDGKGGFA